jgi:predicted deacylase
MNEILSAFGGSYGLTRERFEAAAKAAGATLHRYRHDDPELSCDVAVLGSASAPRRLAMIAGTHGAEGFAGSAVMVDWLRRGKRPDGLTVVLVHAINPWGFANISRCTENNVDLNRNFVDHSAELPENRGYTNLHDALCPARWDDATRLAIHASCDAYGAKHGRHALIDAIMRGQYSHEDGLNYGGQSPEWSNRTMRAITVDHLRGAEALMLIDWHTGLGAYGAASVMCLDPPAHPAYEKARTIFGAEIDAVQKLFEGEEPPQYTGLLLNAVRAEARAETTVACTVEFGTRPLDAMLDGLLVDRWLRLAAPADAPGLAALKAEVRDAFCPQDPVWREAAISAGKELIARANQWLTR